MCGPAATRSTRCRTARPGRQRLRSSSSTCGCDRRRRAPSSLRRCARRWRRRWRPGEQVAAVSQPPRLCAAHPVPGLRPPPALPVVHRLAGRAPAGRAAAMPPLRLQPAAAAGLPGLHAADALAPAVRASSGWRRRWQRSFPRRGLVLATSDTLTGPAAAAELVARIERHEVDLIIGTQIIAKGYHFPLLTLVGVVDADLGLAGGDLRAAERTFQLLYQVGRPRRPGRCGAGRVLLQTTMAAASGDARRWPPATGTASSPPRRRDRRDAGMPPFGRLAALIVSGARRDAGRDAARALARAAPRADGVRVLGPAPAPLALLRGRHRRRLLAIAPRAFPLSRWVHAWVGGVALPSAVRAAGGHRPADARPRPARSRWLGGRGYFSHSS